jgi:hypothetical protein
MLIPNKFNGYHNGTRQLHFSSGGGGGTQTTSTVQNTNVPEYARPYVESMLGATQNQLFNTSPDTTKPILDAQGAPVLDASGKPTYETSIDSFKGYQAYGGTYAKAGDPILGADGQPVLNPDGTPKVYKGGEQLSYDAGKAVAGFSPMQTAAQQGIAGMQMPGQFGAASDFATQAGQGGLKSAEDAMRFGEAGFASGQKGQQLGIAGGAKYGEMGAQYGAQGANLGIAGGAKYGDMGAGYGAQGAGYGSQAAGLANTALGYGQSASDIGRMGLRAEQYGRQVSGQAEDYARQQAGAGAQYAQMATDPRVTQALMNPYTQNVLDVQNKELQRQADIASNVRGAQAARAGAFGGSRQGIENAEAQRNLMMMKNQLIKHKVCSRHTNKLCSSSMQSKAMDCRGRLQTNKQVSL